MSEPSFQLKEITSTGSTILFSTSGNSSGVFCITVSEGAKFTFQTAIDPDGALVDDPIYTDYTISAQDTFEYVSRFVIAVTDLGTDGIIKFEYKLFS